MICRELSARWDWYLNREKGDHLCTGTHDISMLLFYPNIYPVGISNLGFQTIYRIANSLPFVCCDRCFYPELPYEPLLEKGEELVSMELKMTPRQFHVLAFSVSFELDLLKVIKLLQWSRVSVMSTERKGEEPLVIMGGIVPTANPEPFAPFSDVVAIGEGEELIPRVLEVIMEEGLAERERILRRLSRLEGVYVPSLYTPVYDVYGRFKHFKVASGAPARVRKVYQSDFSEVGNLAPLWSAEATFSEARLIEVSRGCPYLCKFCLSSYLCWPLRMVGRERLFHQISQEGDRLGFIGTSLSHYPHLLEAVSRVKSVGKSVAFSSLRIDAPEELLVEISRESNTLTFGIEAATDRLRREIGKPLDEGLIRERIILCLSEGLLNLKFYFMIGLPGEREEDIEALLAFPKRVLHWCKGRSFALPKIHLSISLFVPKPFTPYQWEPMLEREELQRRLRLVEKGLRREKGVTVTCEVPKWSLLQALISRGDRRVGTVLAIGMTKYNGNWVKACKEFNIGMGHYLHRDKGYGEPFPWEVVDVGWDRSLLWERRSSSRI